MVKILVIGAGAIGSFYGFLLEKSGAKMILWCRSNADLIQKNGIKIISNQHNYHFKPYKILKNLEDLDEKIDYVLIATKHLPNIDITALIRKVINPNCKIILIQNGIHIEKNIAKNFPQNELISILAFVAVSRRSDILIEHFDYGRLVIGSYNSQATASCHQLAQMWQKSGIEVKIVDNILRERWKKLVWNASFNPLSVILRGANTQQILSNPLNSELVRNVMAEVCKLAEADDCKLEDDVIENNIQATLSMKPYKTSMLLDFEASRLMEVEAILGNALKFAQSKSITTPYLSTIYAIISNFQKHI
jgi:2-dehydropantoate 2-reductase